MSWSAGLEVLKASRVYMLPMYLPVMISSVWSRLLITSTVRKGRQEYQKRQNAFQRPWNVRYINIFCRKSAAPDVLKFWHQFAVKTAHSVPGQEPESMGATLVYYNNKLLPNQTRCHVTFFPFLPSACRSSSVGPPGSHGSDHPIRAWFIAYFRKKISFLGKTIFTYFCWQRMRLRALGARNLVDEHLLELGVDILDDTRHLLVLGGSDLDD